MIDIRKPFGLASAALLISAGLHIVAILLTLGGNLLLMLAGALLWTVCALLLRRGSRWFAGLAFFLTAFAGCVPFGLGLAEQGVVSYVLFAIAAADWSAAFFLFVALWRSAKPPLKA